MSGWIGDHIASVEGFSVNNFDWRTAKRRDQLTKDVRTKAVKDAVARGEQYGLAALVGPRWESFCQEQGRKTS